MPMSREDLLADQQEFSCIGEKEAFMSTVELSILGKRVQALVDSGSERSVISKGFYDTLIKDGGKLEEIPVKSTYVVTAVGNKSQRVGKQVLLPMRFGNEVDHKTCLVIPNLIYEMILGIDWLNEHSAVIDFDRGVINFVRGNISQEMRMKCKSVDKTVKACVTEVTVGDMAEGKADDEEEVVDLCHIAVEGDKCDQLQQAVDKSGLSVEERDKLLEVLELNQEVFSDKPGLTHVYTHQFEIVDHSPFSGPKYPIPHKFADAVEKEIGIMLNQGIIEPSTSAYLNPLVVVGKSDGSVRLCIDARQLNCRISGDQQRPECVEELVQKFNGKQWFSTMDLSASFWQVPLREQDRKLTAFSFKSGLYQFRVVPFGTKTSSSALIRALNLVLGRDTHEFVTMYIDDLIVASYTLKEHLDHLDIVLGKLRDGGFTIKLKKSLFCTTSITFLGHTITTQGVSPEQSRLDKIHNTATPRNAKQLRSILGVFNYFRRFVVKYSCLVEPFRELLKQGTKWVWTQVHDEAFKELKRGFVETVMLRYPRLDCPYILMTDASMQGISGILCQEDSEGNLGIVSLASRGLSMAEKRYTITEIEMLAIVYSLGKFRSYVLGSKLQILTDHHALLFIGSCKLTSNRMSRWILAISEYNFEVRHIKGTENIVADFMSRNIGGDEGHQVLEVQEGVVICVTKVSECDYEIRCLRNLLVEQEKDEVLGDILTQLRGMDVDSRIKVGKYWYKLECGFLARLCHEGAWRVCVPSSLQVTMIWYHHKALGHFGSSKVLFAVQQHFIWKNMGRQIRKVLASCDSCQRCKCPTRFLEGPRQMVITEKPRDLLCVDLYGPLVKAQFGYQYIFVVVDAFSKLVKLYPLRKATGKGCVLQITDKYVPEFGVPLRILSDHGSQFTSKIWKTKLSELGIKHIFSSIRYPQGNLSERVMRELGRVFRTYVSNRHNAWFSKLGDIERWFNSTFHESVKCTPYEIQYGRKPTNELARMLGLVTGEEIGKDVCIQLARDNLIKAGNKRRRQQKRVKFDSFEVGDQVLLRVPYPSSAVDKEIGKFFHLFQGPFKVVKRIGECAYSLTDQDGKSVSTHNIRNLRRYHSVK